MTQATRESWEFWIDRGGTFTDALGRDPQGRLHTAKVLSSESAPVEAIREIFVRMEGLALGAPLPPCRVRMGTTVATNALLERRGVPTLFVTNAGLGDVPVIGTQERPELFDLAIAKPAPVHTQTLEVAARVAADGARLAGLDEPAALRALQAARAAGAESVAISLMHAYADPEDERSLVAWARECGFAHVVASSDVARELGLLARSETTIVDAYLTPLLERHARSLQQALGDASLRFMQSSGGLTTAERFRGPAALLSGPAGGVVGASEVAAAAGFERAVGFDMGGTSTDVSLLRRGELERSFETVVGGVRVRAPMLRIHTVAAGGGSLCRFDGFRFTVGPESAGADPGPLCYGRPEARELTVTDMNLALGRVQPDRFPFALTPAKVDAALAALQIELRAAGLDRTPEAIAAGFLEVANASMAEAIRQVSVSRGVDPRGCALVGFGGAGGQHVCAIARDLGMRDVLLHPFAGVLSAYGIGRAETSWDGQRDAGRVTLGAGIPIEIEGLLSDLESEGRAALTAEGEAPSRLVVERRLDLRHVGTETALAVRDPGDGRWDRAFAGEHRSRFGYERPGRGIEIVTARVRVAAPGAAAAVPDAAFKADEAPHASREAPVWFPEVGRVACPVFEREALAPGMQLQGPALVLEATGTVAVDPGFTLAVRDDGVLHLQDTGAHAHAQETDLDTPDPVRLEVFGHRFMSIAEQMGAVLRNTSTSTNIKERLDYSCAVFDAEGGLVANAPHIPVHLGAMAETVAMVRARFPQAGPGDAVVTNDPHAGGSHLPDVTIVSPVFLPDGRVPAFFVASRGHHADIGGITPGSMPAHSTSLAEEGVCIEPQWVVREGRFEDAPLRALLEAGPHPARSPEDNLAEFEAMVAANRAGTELLQGLVREQGVRAVAVTMAQLQQAAAGKVRREIARLADGSHAFQDRMDDGTPVCVTLEVSGETLRIDFAGTGPASPGNLNAPRAVVNAAVIYVVRTLVAERIPLNGGCLEPVEIHVPAGSLLDPPPGAAVVGGNVETSQRIVDVLLGAIGRVAASQGTMNNVTFGDARFGYYETVGGGAGAGDGFDGASGVHTHMTNTRITDPEVLETRYPVRLDVFALRHDSGGAGRYRGGDGLVRRYVFTAPVTVSLLSERRSTAPFGLAGGNPARAGENRVEQRDGTTRVVGARDTFELAAGDALVVETPGGGGFGTPEPA